MKIGGEIFQAAPFELTFRRALPQASMLEVNRFLRPLPPRFQASQAAHASRPGSAGILAGELMCLPRRQGWRRSRRGKILELRAVCTDFFDRSPPSFYNSGLGHTNQFAPVLSG